MFFTRTMYHAVMDVKSTIAITENTVIKSDQKNAEKELQKLTDSKIETIEKVGAAKEKEIMEV